MAKSTKIDNNQFSGYVKIFRSIKKNWIWEDAQKLKWWLDILLEVNHTDKKVNIGYELIECKRGESIKSLETWAKEWRVDKSTVRRFMDLLENDSMIVRKNIQKTTHLTVCNYDSYNDGKHVKQLINNSQATPEQLSDNPNNNDNNVKEYNGYTPEQISAFDLFKNWVNENAPSVSNMKEPITIKQYFTLLPKFSKKEIADTLESMHNYNGLEKKYKSAYLTLNSWLKRNEK